MTDIAVDDPVDDDDEVVDLDRLETVSEDIRHFAQQFQQAPSREVHRSMSTGGLSMAFPNRTARDRYLKGKNETKRAGQRPGQRSIEAFMQAYRRVCYADAG